jgi:hypothetical protein
MSDDNYPPFTKHSPRELLHELGSIKELLDEELLEKPVPYTSVNDIGSVEEYLRLKQQAAAQGLSIEEYLSRQAATGSDEPEQVADDDDEQEMEDIPLLDEVSAIEDDDPLESENDSDSLLLELAEEEEEPDHTRSGSLSVEEYFAAVAAAKRPSQAAGTTPASPARDKVIATPNITPIFDESLPLLDDVIDTSGALPPLEDMVATEDDFPLLEDVVAVEGDFPLLEDVVAAEDDFPLLEDVVSAEEAIPLLEDVVAAEGVIPLLDEVAAASPAAMEEQLSLEELQGLVDLIVNRKLERLKPELEREVMEELRKLLPQPSTTH